MALSQSASPSLLKLFAKLVDPYVSDYFEVKEQVTLLWPLYQQLGFVLLSVQQPYKIEKNSDLTPCTFPKIIVRLVPHEVLKDRNMELFIANDDP